MNQNIYTLVRPVIEWEESEATFAAFLTEEEAKAGKARLVDFWKAIQASIGEDPDYDPKVPGSWDIYEAWVTRRDENVKNAEWPFDCSKLYEDDVKYGGINPEDAINVRAVPLFSQSLPHEAIIRHLQDDLAALRDGLKDANIVRLNLLRGTIAWTPETLRSVLGEMEVKP